MRLFCAGIYAANFNLSGSLWTRLTDAERDQRKSVKNVLESYHYVWRQPFVDKIREDGVQVFLDSGAFSAWSKGVEIDVPGYCDYIKRNEDIILKVDGDLWASVLDGIGDPLKTYQNQLWMESMGVRPLPCFHYGEDPRYLEYYVANYSSITIGGMVAQSTEQLLYWLDEIWDKYLTDGAGRPRVRVHGFGLTTPILMRRYPWYSVDSSSWVQVARVGGMLLLPEARVINVSDQSPNRRTEGQHLINIPEVMRDEVIRRLEAENVDVVRAQQTYLARWCYNIYAYTKLGDIITEEKQGDPRFVRDQPGLF